MMASRLLLVGTVLAATLACGGGGGGPVCLGWVESNGQRYAPTSGVADSGEAQHNACNVYCLEGDSKVDAMVAIWRDADPSRASVTKKEAMYQDPGLLEYITVTCANDCATQVAAGTLSGGVQCTP